MKIIAMQVENIMRVKFARVRPKGAVVTFRDNNFSNPAGLVAFIAKESGTVKLRPDHKLVYRRDWTDPNKRSVGVRRFMRNLSAVAAAPEGTTGELSAG